LQNRSRGANATGRVTLTAAVLFSCGAALFLANHATLFHQDDWVWESIVSGDGDRKLDAERAFTQSWRIENAFLAAHRIRETHRVVVKALDIGTETLLEGEVLAGYVFSQEVDVYGSNIDELVEYNRENETNSAYVWSTYPRGVPTVVDVLAVVWLALASFSVGSFQRARGESAESGMSYVVIVAHLLFIAVAIVLSCFFVERSLWIIAGIVDALSASIILCWLLVTWKAWTRAGLSRVPYWIAGCATFFLIAAAFGFRHVRP
jgi:hypothetical protein